MLYLPNNAGQTNLNHKTLVVQPMPKIMPLNPVATISPIYENGAKPDKALVAGQSYLAKVLGKPSAQHYDVLIHQHMYRIQLDKPLQVGELFQLKFLAFVGSLDLPNPQASNSPSSSTTLKNTQTPQFLLQQLTLFGKEAQFNALNTSLASQAYQQPTPSISRAGQLIQSVLTSQLQLAPLLKFSDIASQLQSKMEVPHAQLTAGEVSAAVIAPFLRQQLQGSGLFYESHLQQMTAGLMTPESLREEPQNRPNADTVSLVAKQLEVLETKKLHWHGLAWPGQVMDWLVEVKPKLGNDEDTKTAKELDENQAISSKLQLTLPNLGRLEVMITYEAERLKIKIHTDNVTSQATLLSKQQCLQDAFNRQNQSLVALNIL